MIWNPVNAFSLKSCGYLEVGPVDDNRELRPRANHTLHSLPRNNGTPHQSAPRSWTGMKVLDCEECPQREANRYK